jgi:hypothetical protein
MIYVLSYSDHESYQPLAIAPFPPKSDRPFTGQELQSFFTKLLADKALYHVSTFGKVPNSLIPVTQASALRRYSTRALQFGYHFQEE